MGANACKHRQIIDAAVEEFLENGYAGASMDRVSARANVSKRTVYNHFDSKEALFRAILDEMVGKCRRVFDVLYDPARPIREQLVALGWAEGRLFTDPEFMRLARMVLGETIRDRALAEEMNEKMAAVVPFRRFIEAAHRDGALSVPDIERATDQFLGLLKSEAFWPVIFSGQIVSTEAMGDIVESAVTVFLTHYGSRSG